MKINKLFLPVVAIAAAAAGAWAMPVTKKVAMLDVAVTASPIFCAFDGYCDQTSAATCKLSGTGITFFRLQGIICAVSATGRFYQ